MFQRNIFSNIEMQAQTVNNILNIRNNFLTEIPYFKYENVLFIAPPLKIRFSVPVERVETTIFNPRVESCCFNPLHSYSQSDSQKRYYEKQYTLIETKHSESISCDCSPRFTRAANFTLMQSLCFAPCNVIYYPHIIRNLSINWKNYFF